MSAESAVSLDESTFKKDTIIWSTGSSADDLQLFTKGRPTFPVLVSALSHEIILENVRAEDDGLDDIVVTGSRSLCLANC